MPPPPQPEVKSVQHQPLCLMMAHLRDLFMSLPSSSVWPVATVLSERSLPAKSTCSRMHSIQLDRAHEARLRLVVRHSNGQRCVEHLPGTACHTQSCHQHASAALPGSQCSETCCSLQHMCSVRSFLNRAAGVICLLRLLWAFGRLFIAALQKPTCIHCCAGHSSICDAMLQHLHGLSLRADRHLSRACHCDASAGVLLHLQRIPVFSSPGHTAEHTSICS